MTGRAEWRSLGVLICGIVSTAVIAYGVIRLFGNWLLPSPSGRAGIAVAVVLLVLVFTVVGRAIRSGVTGGQWRSALIATAGVFAWFIAIDSLLAELNVRAEVRGGSVLVGVGAALAWLVRRWGKEGSQDAAA